PFLLRFEADGVSECGSVPCGNPEGRLATLRTFGRDNSEPGEQEGHAVDELLRIRARTDRAAVDGDVSIPLEVRPKERSHAGIGRTEHEVRNPLLPGIRAARGSEELRQAHGP